MNIYDCYRSLADAIIIKACSDYRERRLSRRAFAEFVHSEYFKTLTSVSGDLILDKLDKELKENAKNKK